MQVGSTVCPLHSPSPLPFPPLPVPRPSQRVPLLFMCNKMDLVSAAQPAAVAAALHLPASSARAFQLQACSAMQGSGIKVREKRGEEEGRERGIMCPSSTKGREGGREGTEGVGGGTVVAFRRPRRAWASMGFLCGAITGTYWRVCVSCCP